MQDVYPSILSKTISDLVEEIISQNLIFISSISLPWQFENRQYMQRFIILFWKNRFRSQRNVLYIKRNTICYHFVFSLILTERAEIPLMISTGCSIQQLSPIRRGKNNESGERCMCVYIRAARYTQVGRSLKSRWIEYRGGGGRRLLHVDEREKEREERSNGGGSNRMIPTMLRGRRSS